MKFSAFFAASLFPLLSFPLFYFVYKYGDPEPIAHDYFQYYHMYQRMELEHVISPHNMRFVGAFFVFLIYKLNLFFDTACAVDKYEAWGFMKQVYFSSVLFNYLCVNLTCLIIYQTLKKQFSNPVLALSGGILYLFGFGTLFYCLMPLTEAFSILVFAVFLIAYFEQKSWGHLILVLLIFQREYLLVMIGTLAAMDYLRTKNKYYLWMCLSAVLCFGLYYVLRKTAFYFQALDYQSSPSHMWQQLTHLAVNWSEYLRQLLLGMNLVIVYGILLIYKWRRELKIDWYTVWAIAVLFAEVNFAAISGGHGTNVGRYFYLAIPFVIIAIVKEASFVFEKQKYPV